MPTQNYTYNPHPLPPVTPVISLGVDTIAAVGVGAAIIIMLSVVTCFYVYYVRKDRKVEKRALKAAKRGTTRRGDDGVEWGRKAELDTHETGVIIAELEQPGTTELEGNKVNEMWAEGCIKEIDGAMRIVEIGGNERELSPSAKDEKIRE